MSSLRTRSRTSATVLAATGLVLVLPLSSMLACSPTANTTSPGSSGPGGAGGSGAVGGNGASAGTGATQGSGGKGGSSATCNQRTADPNDFPSCGSCPGGRCVQTAAVPESARPLLAQCDPANLCVPEDVVATRGNVKF